jgi:hypothetical protein
VEEHDFAIVFSASAMMLRVQKVREFSLPPLRCSAALQKVDGIDLKMPGKRDDVRLTQLALAGQHQRNQHGGTTQQLGEFLGGEPALLD